MSDPEARPEFELTSDASSKDRLADRTAELDALARSESGQAFLRVFSRYLDRDITESTITELRWATSLFLSDESFSILLWLANSSEPSKLLGSLTFSPVAQAFTIDLLAQYGPRLRRALYAADGEFARSHDWRNFGREIYHDIIADEYSIEISIEKYNGETLLVRGAPGSLMALTSGMIRSLTLVDDPSAFADDEVSEFDRQIERLREMLAKPTTKARAE